MRQTIAARHEALTRLMKALARAEDYIIKNREDSLRIVIARLTGKAKPAEIRDAWNDFNFNVRLDNALFASMKREAQWYRDNGKYAEAIPDFGNAIATAPLRSARPQAVTVQTATKRP